MEIKNIIASRRKDLGMTQKELGDKLHVTFQTISKWENGKSLPDLSMLEPLAKALNLSLIELLGAEEQSIDEAVVNTLDYSKQKISKTKAYLRIVSIGCIILSIILSFFLFSSVSKFFQNNVVSPVKLSKSEKENLNSMIGLDQYNFYEVKADESFNSLYLVGWTKIDDVIEKTFGIMAPDTGGMNDLSLAISDMGEYRYKVNGGAMSVSGQLDDYPTLASLLKDYNSNVVEYEWLEEQVKIEDGKPIRLMRRTYTVCPDYGGVVYYYQPKTYACKVGEPKIVEQDLYLIYYKDKTVEEMDMIYNTMEYPDE